MERKYQFSDFNDHNAWLIFRMDIFLKDKVADVYLIMDLPSGMILGSDITETELSQKQVDALLEKAMFKAGEAPKQFVLAYNDPVELFLQRGAQSFGIKVKIVSATLLEDLTEDVKSSFVKEFGGISPKISNDTDELDFENAKRAIPDSYDLCSCASGLKYKFCCKRIFMEITNAMVSAEEGNFKEAFESIAKARKLVGNTAEVLCREAIVYSFFDIKKSEDFLEKCLAVNPKHPRAHYLQGISLTEQGDLKGALKAYETAISYYPKTDHYHLNETHNNLGLVYYQMGNYAKAKSEWELALHFLPTDEIAQRNLRDFVYSKNK